MTEKKKWWHAYGGFAQEYGAFAVMTLGPTGGPDDPTTDPSKTFREITLPLGDEQMVYLASWDHEPSDFEKDQIQPEEYREYNPDGTFIEPTVVLTSTNDEGAEVTTHHRTGDVVQALLKGEHRE
jgi:hypothetical protein